jgi:hypothetical protein
LFRLGEPAPILLELRSGMFAAATALPDFIASVVTTDRGVAALVYRGIYAPQEAEATEDAIGRLERGAIRADEAMDLAVGLRQGKHADPASWTRARPLSRAVCISARKAACFMR